MDVEPEHPPSEHLPKEENKMKANVFQGNSGGDDDWCEVLGSHKQCSQSFLYVHHSGKRGYLSITETSASTYKTTRYDLALFFI